MSKITLVTGGTGFIGSHLVEKLVLSGREVRCLVKPKSSLEYLKGLKVDLFYGDLTKPESLKGINEGVGTVFHLAAIARPMSIPDEIYTQVNVQGTKNLLEAFSGKNLKKFIYLSSISVVGPSRDGRPVNEKTPTNPIDIYGQSKLAAEKVVFDFIKEYQMPIVVLRPPMVFGPKDFEMLKLFKAVKTGFFPIKSNPHGHFEFCYVKNLILACLLAEKKGKTGEIYHVSNERSYTLKEVIKSMAQAEGVNLLKFYFPNWLLKIGGSTIEFVAKIFRFHPPFSRNTVVWMTTNFWISDISKIKEELGYRPRYSLEEGIKEAVEWYKEKQLL